jgi:predicted nucleic acid-binding Zn ribbon protein
MKHINQTLNDLFKTYGIAEKVDKCRVVEKWPNVVGNNIGKISEAKRIEGKTLIVKVKSSTWKTELMMQKPQIIEKINQLFDKNIIQDIRFI